MREKQLWYKDWKEDMVMDGVFQTEQLCVMLLLRESLTGQENQKENEEFPWEQVDWEKFLELAENHKVLSLLYDVMEAKKEQFPEYVLQRAGKVSKRIVMQSYRLLFISHHLISKLQEKGISVILLKGVGTASFYPVPELRKTGDIDLLLPEVERLEEACRILEENGCKRNGTQYALHHVQFVMESGIEVELHTMLAEPFDNNRINEYLQRNHRACAEHIVNVNTMGLKIPILSPEYHAYELLLHMLQHFLRSGFGLKLLCDWVVFWNCVEGSVEQKDYLRFVSESRIKGFSDVVTESCCRFLGLRRDAVQWMEMHVETTQVNVFMKEVWEAEEFGKSSADRVVALRNVKPTEYIREFHHQTQINYPKASKCALCWPVLWLLTLIRFLHNNHKVRNVSARAVLRQAGRRGNVIEEMNLWEKK